MPFERPTTDPTDLYYRDRILATTPFNPVEFAKTFEHRRARIQDVNFHYSIDGPEMGEILLPHINEIWHFPMNAARLSPSFASGREEQFIPQFFTQWVYNVGAIQPEDITEYVRTAKIPGAIECGASYYNKPPAYTPDGKVLPENSLTMPLKYIGAELGFGGHLGGDRQRAFKTIDRYAMNASYEVVDRCSHWVAEDRPVYIAEKIAEFFS